MLSDAGTGVACGLTIGPIRQLPISFWIVRNYYSYCRSEFIFHIVFTRQFLLPWWMCHNMMFCEFKN